MEDLIPLVIKLQEAFDVIASRQSIELPIIVSVGSQSSGKSSVIESIVGRDFLPRGTGIVTRCPLVLSLRRIDDGESDKKKEWGEFLHKKGVKLFDFSKIREEIDSQTEKICGTQSKCLSETPINLTIYSPNVVDLTLVDLPGITKVPVLGQPSDVEEQVRRLILSYVTQPNALILAISSANQDIANSDALKLAREVDAEGERTIGVITKIDLMDEGTNAMELLQGSVYPLKLGYYGVKCRSQQNILDNMSIKQAIINEKDYFSQHPVYCHHSKTLGIPFLSK